MNKEKINEPLNRPFTYGVNENGEKTVTMTQRKLRWLIVIISLAMFGAGRILTIYQYFP